MRNSNGAFNPRILKVNRYRPLPSTLSFFIAAAVFLFGQICSRCYARQDLLRVHFIDVGYGDAVFIELPGSANMMIDAGGKPYAPRLINYLRASAVRAIDTAVITHPHKNHFEGFSAVVKHMPVGRAFVNGDENAEEGYAELLKAFRRRHVPIEILSRGQKLDGLPPAIEVEVLHPGLLSGSPNDNSIVLRLTYREVAVLFMADVGPEGQEEVIARHRDIDKADCIKVPHHGGPLSDGFLQTFIDKIFIISTGSNAWGWPREEDLKKIKGKIYRTDHHGTVVLETDGRVIKMLP